MITAHTLLSPVLYLLRRAVVALLFSDFSRF
jgi:hypothetical protein